ncbi:MAG: redox-sensing transcriptional repressor Rex [Oscillospiraceae bacterium]
MSKEITKVSNSVIGRLPMYYRFLIYLKNNGINKISSSSLAEKMHLNASQIRQDLNCFGGFGQQGYGYNIDYLIDVISSILDLTNLKNIIIVGAGKLGVTLVHDIDFQNLGFKLFGVYDNNKDILGTSINNNIIQDISNIENLKTTIDVAVLCVPKEYAKQTTVFLTKCGIKTFWNFTHQDLQIYFNDIIVENVHLSDSLMKLSYKHKHKHTSK